MTIVNPVLEERVANLERDLQSDRNEMRDALEALGLELSPDCKWVKSEKSKLKALLAECKKGIAIFFKWFDTVVMKCSESDSYPIDAIVLHKPLAEYL